MYFFMNWTPISHENIKWLGIDFDNTIASNSGYPDFIPSEPLPCAVETLHNLVADGYKIIIYTARPWADYHNIEKYCEIYGIPARRIICGKPLFNLVVDDKNIEFDGDWEIVEYKIWKRNHSL